jgi:hypothetical protein
VTRSLGLLLVVIFTALCEAAPQKSVPVGWKVYRSSDYGFEIAYAPDMTSEPVIRPSYIPVCAHNNVVCFEYSGNEYEGTNFGAAGLSINILRDRRTQEDCNQIDTGSDPINEETINGVRFHFGETDGAAASHAIWGPAYRSFHENVCFELAVGITATSLGVYDPGTIKEFRGAKLLQELQAMVHTFRFVGHVLDGPAWDVHHTFGCGGSFEYPDSDTVVAAIEYSQARFYSNGLTCKDYFVHGGLYYTVAKKANLAQKDFAAWLVSAGYPDLSNAELIRSFAFHKMYKAGPYHYVYGQAGAFILSVSDAKGKVIDPDGDRVFNHLVNSFEPD